MMLRIRKYIKKPIKWPFVGIALSVGVLLVLTSILSVFAVNPNLPCDVGASEAVPPDTCTIIDMYAADMGEDQYPEDLNLWNPVLEISGALWDYFPSDQASGTGVFNTYLAVKAHGSSLIERGYNTGVEKKDHVAYYDEDDAKTSVLPLSKVPVVDIDGTLYREFACDINEVSGLPDQLISLEVLQIWQTDEINIGDGTNLYSDPMSPDYEFSSLASLVYDLDCDENVTLIMDYGVNTGSGKPDYKVFVPNDWFDNSIENVIMLVVHGNIEEQNPSSKKDPNEYYGMGSSSGFEEWGVRVFEAQTGCLEVCKLLDTSAVVGPLAELPDGTFEITVTGPSYPGGTTLSFPVTDGAIVGDTCKDVGNLTPGDYTVTETSIPTGWVLQGISGSPATVSPGDACGDVTVNVTNELLVTCETACAAQANPGETIFPGAANWFTYIIYDTGTGHNSPGTAQEFPIFAGKTQLIGTLFVYDSSDTLFVKYSIEGAEPGCVGYFNAYHLQVDDEYKDLRRAIVKKKNPVPGQCEYKGSLNNVPETDWIAADISGYGDSDVYIFAHSVACYYCAP